MEGKAMCPGSFDPITYGHMDIITRTSKIFDEVVVAIFDNERKKHLFTLEERLKLAEDALDSMPNVTVEAGEGLLVRYARKRGIAVVIKGLRAVSDFEYEFQMAQMNRSMGNNVETLFMMTKPEHSYLSSSIVKELAHFEGDIGEMVPDNVAAALRNKLPQPEEAR